MYKGTVTYKEYNKITKIEVNSENIFTLLEMISHFDDLEIQEVHIHKEVV